MIQRHSRDPSGMVTCVTLKKSPIQAVKAKTRRKTPVPMAQPMRARRRRAAYSASKVEIGSAGTGPAPGSSAVAVMLFLLNGTAGAQARRQTSKRDQDPERRCSLIQERMSTIHW